MPNGTEFRAPTVRTVPNGVRRRRRSAVSNDDDGAPQLCGEFVRTRWVTADGTGIAERDGISRADGKNGPKRCAEASTASRSAVSNDDGDGAPQLCGEFVRTRWVTADGTGSAERDGISRADGKNGPTWCAEASTVRRQ
ncbi:hypothetical protein GCM10011512_24960 [Tersicoccus solisilvae]|uniref:Uncharacterized protein n=1 Tax=Tersicoccus solisilvae TaxID=1882339 RepID=A0ABQ1PGT7_9MICC|nr:hypothetical protein GCM10011512_24960 [Tersicoccus solisilvae]